MSDRIRRLELDENLFDAIEIDLVLNIEREIGVTASIGLSYNKSLAKVASDLDKPRGFAIIGRAEAMAFLEPQPISLIWGVGKATLARMHAHGIHSVGDLQRQEAVHLRSWFGTSHGDHLWRLARGLDECGPARPVCSSGRRTLGLSRSGPGGVGRAAQAT